MLQSMQRMWQLAFLVVMYGCTNYSSHPRPLPDHQTRVNMVVISALLGKHRGH